MIFLLENNKINRITPKAPPLIPGCLVTAEIPKKKTPVVSLRISNGASEDNAKYVENKPRNNNKATGESMYPFVIRTAHWRAMTEIAPPKNTAIAQLLSAIKHPKASTGNKSKLNIKSDENT